MKANWTKKILAGTMAAMMVLGANGIVFAKEPEPLSVIQPRYSDVRTKKVTAVFSTSSSVKCTLTIRAASTSTEISGTLTLSGSDGSEYSWDIEGTSSVSFSKTVTGCTADEYTLTFTGYCGSDYIDIDSVATR